MTDNIDEARKEGARQAQVEGRLTNLEARVARIEKFGSAIIAAILAAWAKAKGLF